jgi:fibronectin-binding autotransporter adhesin
MGGTLNVTIPGTVVQYDYVNGTWTPFTGTLNLTGTVPNALLDLHFNGGSFDGGWGSATVNLNSVTLVGHHNSGGNTFFIGALNGTSASFLGGSEYAGPESWKVGGLNVDCTFAGSISNYSATTNIFTKIGTGNLTLSGTNNLSGAMTVSNGTLTVTGSTMATLFNVAVGKLAGTGQVGPTVTVQTGASISPGVGAGNAGTLIVNSNLTLNAPTLYFDLSSSPSGANDQIVLQGGLLTMSGTQNYNFNLLNYALGAGTYSLISGAANNTASGVSLVNNLPANTRQTFTMQRPASGSGSGYVQLAVTGNAGSLVWQGTNGNNWDNATTNWQNGTAADIFFNLDQVRFDDTASNGSVSIIGAVQPATVLVTNNLLTYTISNGVLAGITSLTKSGPGMLILNSSNSFSGGTFVNGGTLQFVNSFYAGGVGPITLNGGTLYLNGIGTGTTVSSIGTNTLQTSGQPYSGFNLQGSGVLNLNIGGGGVFSPGGNWNGFSGTLNFLTGNWIRELDTVSFGSSNAVWNFGNSGGLYNKYGGSTIWLGALFGGSGAGLSGATTATASLTTFVVGGVNTNGVFNGTISDGGAAATALVFNGPGSLTLTGNNTFSGGTIVNGGSLIINSAGNGTGSGPVSINPGGTLGGNGVIGGQVSFAAGATLAPGSNGSGTLTITNDLGLNNASVLQFQLGTNSDQVSVTGDFTLGGTLNISDAGGFGPGTYTLFTYGGTLSIGTLTIGATPASYTYSIDTSIPGQVNLDVAMPQFSNIRSSGGNFVFNGSNGTPFGNYYVLATTNIAQSLSNWTRIATNQFDANGGFNITITNQSGSGQSQSFLQLQLP